MTEPEHCDHEGARLLADRIRAYWKARGHGVNVETIEAGFTGTMRTARVDIRSDMVNGWPVKGERK